MSSVDFMRTELGGGAGGDGGDSGMVCSASFALWLFDISHCGSSFFFCGDACGASVFFSVDIRYLRVAANCLACGQHEDVVAAVVAAEHHGTVVREELEEQHLVGVAHGCARSRCINEAV